MNRRYPLCNIVLLNHRKATVGLCLVKAQCVSALFICPAVWTPKPCKLFSPLCFLLFHWHSKRVWTPYCFCLLAHSLTLCPILSLSLTFSLHAGWCFTVISTDRNWREQRQIKPELEKEEVGDDGGMLLRGLERPTDVRESHQEKDDMNPADLFFLLPLSLEQENST